MPCGLNHIPLKQTKISEIVEELIFSQSQIASLFKLSDLDTLDGSTWLKEYFWHDLKLVVQKNHGGFKLPHSSELSSMVIEELKYLMKYFYIFGIDKANNNIAIICIVHIRGMALQRHGSIRG